MTELFLTMMTLPILHFDLLLLFVSMSSTVRILSRSPTDCSGQGLECTVTTSNCMDKQWLDVNEYTPSSPEGLRVSVETKEDETGHLHPVLVSNWKIKDDGSIRYLKATELHVLVVSTNQNFCVRFAFKDSLPMRSPSGEKWSFSADSLVVNPGQKYHISVFNIPKPEINHSSYDVSDDITVPDCQSSNMQMTQFCIERGSLWQPDISLTQTSAELVVSFTTDTHCEKYMVIVICSTTKHLQNTSKSNQTTLNVTFSLDKWPRSCCQFHAEIKPLFPQCGQDCARRQRTLDICPAKPRPTDVPVYIFVILGVVLTCVMMAVIVYVLCRKPGKSNVNTAPLGGETLWPQQLKQAPKVLVIYSQDHHLYRDIVLKLCAFLQAKCGTKVLVDLLDSTSVSMVGRLRWLEWQRQQLQNPSDKILILCSKGVQAKWRAMCGQGRVTLREDVLSPTDDMLTPFLNLFLPDMYQAGMLSKYMVAFFDDISREQDVPSVFDIAVKYKLMKHFEELYFRILDMEKYQPGQVKHIKGIGGNEYFDCPSGQALKNAIETFQAYQLEHPNWFEEECVDCEDDLLEEANLLIHQHSIPPVLELVPLIRDGLPVCIHQVELKESGDSVHVLTPELNPEGQGSSQAQLFPVVKPEFLSNLDEVLIDTLDPHSPRPQSIYTNAQKWLSLQAQHPGQLPTEDDEQNSLLPISQRSDSNPRGLALQDFLDSQPEESLCASTQTEYFPPSETGHSPPVALEEEKVVRPDEEGPSSGSDQGYISKMSSQHDPPLKEDPLVTLRRLQEDLFQNNRRLPDTDSELN